MHWRMLRLSSLLHPWSLCGEQSSTRLSETVKKFRLQNSLQEISKFGWESQVQGVFWRKWGQKSEIEQVGSRRKWDIVGLDLVLVTNQFWEAFYSVYLCLQINVLKIKPRKLLVNPGLNRSSPPLGKQCILELQEASRDIWVQKAAGCSSTAENQLRRVLEG